MIKDLLINKTSQEKAQIKSLEIAKLKHSGIYNSAQYNTKIEIIGDVKAIEINGQHGIELFAKGWRGTQQLGFGIDGTVEIERFRIFNPPILVDDPNGTIIREWTNDITGQLKQRKLREDPLEAIRQVISHNVKIVGKDNNKIVAGKIGNTTSTFYPDADPETTSVDGRTRYDGNGVTWATFQAADGGSASDVGTELYAYLAAWSVSNQWDLNDKTHFLFDSSSIPDTDVISSATFSLYGTGTNNNPLTLSLNVYSTNPASNTAIAAGDHDTVGTTAFSTAKAQSTITAAAYYDWALNASGLTNVSKTGVSKFGFSYTNLPENVEPTWSSLAENSWGHYHADQTGTANDPKLVVVHGVADLSINVNDTLSITESTTLSNIQLGSISVNDTLSITESTTQTLVSNISVNDTLSITESTTQLLIYNISVNDTLSITESATLSNSQLGGISVNDIFSITESTTQLLISDISINDQLTITESVSQTLLSNISVSDILAITEDIIRILISHINIVETSLIIEDVVINNSDLGGININETLAVTESSTITNATLAGINLNEVLSITESSTITNATLSGISLNETLSITESVTIFETEEGGNPNVSDTLTLTENLTVSISLLGGINLSETLALTESVTMFETETGGNPEVSDTLAISESITLENFRFSPSRTVPIGSVKVFSPYGR